MSARRGLTLVEVLAALVLLSALAAAAAPVLRCANAPPPPQGIDLLELSLIADEIMASGVHSPEHAVAVRRIPVQGGAWIAFTCDDRHIFRWVKDP